MPFREPKPEEIITQAYKILGTGQTSLAKYLFITTKFSNEQLDIHNVESFFIHILERVDWETNLHFQTKVTIDTLDYSGSGWNEGSKVIVGVHGKPTRTLKSTLPTFNLPKGFNNPQVIFPGAIAIEGPKFQKENTDFENLASALNKDLVDSFPLIILVDDSKFTAQNIANFVWVTFTRSNPSSDVHGVDSFMENKHWGCKGSLIIDARVKPHHAPALIVDRDVEERVDEILERYYEQNDINSKPLFSKNLKKIKKTSIIL